MRAPLAISTSIALSIALAMVAPALAETIHLKADLEGAAEAAEIPKDAKGEAMATFDTETRALEWEVTYSGLSGPAFAAHIHGPAEPGQDAGIQIGFENPASPITGTATLTEEQVTELLAGKYYVNIHTEAQRGGEIRGFLKIVKDAM